MLYALRPAMRRCLHGSWSLLAARNARCQSHPATARAYTSLGPASKVQLQEHGLQWETPRLSVDAVPIVHHPRYSSPVADLMPASHRFPMRVFETIHALLLEEGLVQGAQPALQVIQPEHLPTKEMLRLVHGSEYLDAFLSGCLPENVKRRIGLQEVVCSEELIERTLWEVSGTLTAAQLALEHGVACSTAGGTHHAFPDAGAGFCIVNDLAITTETLLATHPRVDRVLILDLDVHQGDGTAACFSGRDDVFTCSFHAEKNFPTRKEQSTLDVGLPDGMGDATYCRRLSEVLPGILQDFRPDLVLYDAGVDPHESDELGRLSLSTRGLLQRDTLVMDTMWDAGIPVAGYVGGGYHRDLRQLALWHSTLHRAASACWQRL